MSEELFPELPSKWILTNLGKLCDDIFYGYTAKAIEEKVGPRFLRISDIQDNNVLWKNVPFCEIEEGKISKYLLKPGDIVFARTGGTVGKSYLIKDEVPFAIFASYLIKLDLSKHVSNKYISYYFKSNYYWRQIYEGKIGMGQANVNATKLKKLIIPLAPYNEQIRIVNRLEELLSRNEVGQRTLQKTQKQLEKFKQSILKKAYTGKLTRKWRKIHQEKNVEEYLNKIKEERKKLKFKRRYDLKIDLNINFPKSWELIKLDDIAMVADVDHKMPKDHPNGIPFLSPKDFEEPDKINLDNIKTISRSDYEKLSKKIRPNENDLLYSRIGTVGKVRKAPRGITYQASYSLCIIRTSPKTKEYIYWILQAPDVLMQAIEGQRSVGVPDLGLRDIRNFLIPFPPKEEQNEIVNRLEFMFSIINNNQKTLTDLQVKTDKLKHSIFDGAFEGRLVPQDPEDEPASVLLERIKVDKQGVKQMRLV